MPLQLSEAKNIIWNIDKFWFNNFKSYGDNNEITWDNVSGIVQISGENQQGKSTILDAICFILYGTTQSTTIQSAQWEPRRTTEFSCKLHRQITISQTIIFQQTEQAPVIMEYISVL